MKVYGLSLWIAHGPAEANGNRQRRAIVAAPNQRAAAAALKVPLHHLRTYGSETGNAEEIDVASQTPGTVLWNHGGRWHPLEKEP